MPRNIIDKYSEWTTDLIREDVQSKAFPYAVLMVNWSSDFNFGTLIRNANAFGCKEIFYRGAKRYNPKGAVGCDHYSKVTYLDSDEAIDSLANEYTFVALETGVSAVGMSGFVWPERPLLIFGEEACGLSPELLSKCKHVVEIAMFGSVRSLNVGVTSGIAMNDFVTKYIPMQ